MLAFFYSFALIFAETHGAGDTSAGGFLDFYNHYLNIPGFEAWKFFNLAIFVGILTYLVKKPVTDAFKAKRETIRAELIKAEQEKEAALAQLTAAEAKLVRLESEKSTYLNTRRAGSRRRKIAYPTANRKRHQQNARTGGKRDRAVIPADKIRTAPLFGGRKHPAGGRKNQKRDEYGYGFASGAENIHSIGGLK